MGGVFAAGHSAVTQYDEFFASRECFHYDMVTARADDPVWAAMQQRHAALENEFAASAATYADNVGCVCVCFPFPSLCARVTGPRIFLRRVSAYARRYEIRRERVFLRVRVVLYFSNSKK